MIEPVTDPWSDQIPSSKGILSWDLKEKRLRLMLSFIIVYEVKGKWTIVCVNGAQNYLNLQRGKTAEVISEYVSSTTNLW